MVAYNDAAKEGEVSGVFTISGLPVIVALAAPGEEESHKDSEGPPAAEDRRDLRELEPGLEHATSASRSPDVSTSSEPLPLPGSSARMSQSAPGSSLTSPQHPHHNQFQPHLHHHHPHHPHHHPHLPHHPHSHSPRHETWKDICLQVSFPFLFGGLGTIAAGVILGIVESWDVFSDIHALFILVPALQGLKGNLDTCLASRLSTQANKGNMVSFREIRKMIIGNLALVQVQAIVAAIVVSIFALSVSSAMNGDFNVNDALLLCSASLMTATSSCFFLDLVLVTVIVVSHRYHMNPDNVATPFAASVGDVICLTIFSQIATLLYGLHDTHWWILVIVIVFYIIILPFWVWLVMMNEYARPVLKSGWLPVISALFISGMGGLVLDTVVDQFKGYVVFQPIVNGIGGNLVSVQASRISTYLHVTPPCTMGVMPPETRQWASPWSTLISGLPSARTARILIVMAILGQSLFVVVADLIHTMEFTIQAPFFFTYLLVSTLQVTILLYVAHLVVHGMWRLKTDPDNSSIPYLTALGDLIGSCLLSVGFLFLQTVHQEYSG